MTSEACPPTERKIPCPACDVEAMCATPLMAMALGASIADGFGDVHKLTELMCEQHRGTWCMAMMRASIALNTHDAEDPHPFGDDADAGEP